LGRGREEGEGRGLEELERLLRERGLTDSQVKAGLRYYERFASKFDIPLPRVAEMVAKMVENMRRAYEKALT
jgi:hypothetical protein